MRRALGFGIRFGVGLLAVGICTTELFQRFTCRPPAPPCAPPCPSTISGVEDIDRLVEEMKVIHPTHCAVFWALDATAKGLSGVGGSAAEAAAAEVAWSRVVDLADACLPEFHHEKVVYWDSLAQARVVKGDLKVGGYLV